MTDFHTLIDCEVLHSQLDDDDLVILDGTWFLPNVDRDAKAEFNEKHIPGARFFDIDANSDQSSSLPHMIPTANAFSESVEKLGISNSSKIAIYDAQGLFSAARVWWLFRLFGHQQVAVVDGGLPAWVTAGFEITDLTTTIKSGTYQSTFDPIKVVDLTGMQQRVRDQSAIVLDARSAGRFNGSAPEPRPELKSGHMPGAYSLPATDLLVDGKLKPITELQSIFQRFSITKESPVVTSCGSGVTAAIITLAMAHSGLGMHQLYDGSWTEWASVGNNPIDQG